MNAPDAIDKLVKLADAASKIVHGPQGGAYSSNAVSVSASSGQHSQEYTNNQPTDRTPAGFTHGTG